MIVKMSVISGYWNIWAHVRWLLLDCIRVRSARSMGIAYLEPCERATFNDKSLLVLEGELVKVFVPVGAFGTDPFQEEEEQSRDCKRFV